MTPSENFRATLYAALWFETGGLFDPNDPECINGTNRKKCGTSGGKHDKGGNTKFGVAQNAHPELDIDSLTLAQAAEVYRQGYWDSCKCDQLPDDVASYTFDAACGSGPRVAIKLLQRALGVADDGSIGPVTLSAVQAKDPAELLEAMRQQRHAFYQAIADRDQSQAKFLPGWGRRANTFIDKVYDYRPAHPGAKVQP